MKKTHHWWGFVIVLQVKHNRTEQRKQCQQLLSPLKDEVDRKDEIYMYIS